MNRIQSGFPLIIRKKGCAMSEVVLRLSGVSFSYDRQPVLEGSIWRWRPGNFSA